MHRGFVKLYRKLLEWEWYTDSNVKSLYIHLLIKANHSPKKWQGITINKGQVLTGRKVLSVETGLSEMQVRTALKKLESTQNITISATSKNSIITVCNYESYAEYNQQDNQQVTSEITNKQPTDNQQVTTTKNTKNSKNNNNSFNFKKAFVDLGVEKETLEDWLKVRKNKRASNTETAFKSLRTKIENSGLTAQECIKYSAEEGWKGFDISWIKNNNGFNNQKQNLRTSEGLNENYSSGI